MIVVQMIAVHEIFESKRSPTVPSLAARSKIQALAVSEIDLVRKAEARRFAHVRVLDMDCPLRGAALNVDTRNHARQDLDGITRKDAGAIA